MNVERLLSAETGHTVDERSGDVLCSLSLWERAGVRAAPRWPMRPTSLTLTLSLGERGRKPHPREPHCGGGGKRGGLLTHTLGGRAA